MYGSTTFSVVATATAASTAFPPASSMRTPAREARGCADATMPCGATTAGREATMDGSSCSNYRQRAREPPLPYPSPTPNTLSEAVLLEDRLELGLGVLDGLLDRRIVDDDRLGHVRDHQAGARLAERGHELG